MSHFPLSWAGKRKRAHQEAKGCRLQSLGGQRKADQDGITGLPPHLSQTQRLSCLQSLASRKAELNEVVLVAFKATVRSKATWIYFL